MRIPRTICPAGCEWTFITSGGMKNHLKNKHPDYERAEYRIGLLAALLRRVLKACPLSDYLRNDIEEAIK